jgi:8-oxo-dGTP pyrophosphatase MutT (NUDIX family)
MNYHDEPKFKSWKSKMTGSGCIINNIEPLQLIHKKNGELLFAMIKADITTPEGGKLPPIVVIRGDVVVIVPKVRNTETKDERFLMIRQNRVGNGKQVLEFPAGMLDRNIDDPVGCAVEEVKEETGLRIKRNDLFSLSDKALYTSPGLNDEAVNFFGCIIDLSDEEYTALEGKKEGAFSEGEETVVTLKAKSQIFKETNAAQVLLGLYLFEDALKARSRA